MSLTVFTPDLVAAPAVIDPTPAQAVSHLQAIGWTHRAAAQQLNITESYLCRVLNGHLSSRRLLRAILELGALPQQRSDQPTHEGHTTPPVSFAARLTQLMRDRGLTQQQIAQAAGVTHVAVRRWLHMGAIPRGDYLLRLTDHLGIHPRDLIPA